MKVAREPRGRERYFTADQALKNHRQLGSDFGYRLANNAG